MGSVRHFTESNESGGTYDNDQQSAVTEYLRTGYPTEDMITGGDIERESDVIPMGTASLADIVTGQISNPTAEEIDAAKKTLESAEMPNIAEQAVKKLNEEMKKLSGSEKTFAELCMGFLAKRCRESQSLAEDICQTHKTWRKCYKYIFDKAKKYLGGISGPVLDATVFEWVEDYYHLDDKAEEKKKSGEEAEREKKAAESQKKTVKSAKSPKTKNEKISGKAKVREEGTKMQPTEKKTPAAPMREAIKQDKPKKKAKKGELEGQMDLFSMMEM